MHKFIYEKNRVTAFCDAVFSIAMTLLILEIDVPSSDVLNQNDFLSVLANRTPNFIGFLVSFMVIAIYWVSHLRIFSYVQHINEKLIWLNIALLLCVVFLPFSTAIYVGDFYGTAPFVFYCCNLIILGLLNYFLVHYISKKERGFNGMTETVGKWLKFRSANAVLVWTLAALLAPFFPITARIIFVLIFIIQAIGDRYYKKKISVETVLES
jgi:uncharacterized membrane protein